MREGIEGAPRWLTFGSIYPMLRQRLRVKGLPLPNQRGIDTAAEFPFCINSAHGRRAPGRHVIQGPGSSQTNASNLAERRRLEHDDGFAHRDEHGNSIGGSSVERDPAVHLRAEHAATLPAEQPTLPNDIDISDLDADIRAELRTLVHMKAQLVGGHLVMAGRLIDEDPETAYAHARAAQQLAPRLAATREALGLAAYLTDRYAEALSELHAARRITGSDHQWAVMADCERGLSRPQKALEMARGPEAKNLDKATQIELLIVAAGAHRDMGHPDAAVRLLESADLTPARPELWTARLRYAYADALLDTGREDEARDWFAHASEVDPEGLTDARERLVAWTDKNE